MDSTDVGSKAFFASINVRGCEPTQSFVSVRADDRLAQKGRSAGSQDLRL